jgi:hypothetical protein
VLALGGDIARQVEALIVENLVRLGAVFIVQTIVLPLLYVGFLFWLYRALTTARFAAAPRLPA